MSNKMTPKQREVYNLLAGGHKPAAIARKLKISPSGVYGHIRKMREQGVVIPGEAVGNGPQAAPTGGAPTLGTAAPQASGSNGRATTPEEFLRDAIGEAQTKLHEVGAVIEQHETAIVEAKDEKTRLEERVEKLTAAEQALV